MTPPSSSAKSDVTMPVSIPILFAVSLSSTFFAAVDVSKSTHCRLGSNCKSFFDSSCTVGMALRAVTHGFSVSCSCCHCSHLNLQLNCAWLCCPRLLVVAQLLTQTFHVHMTRVPFQNKQTLDFSPTSNLWNAMARMDEENVW